MENTHYNLIRDDFLEPAGVVSSKEGNTPYDLREIVLFFYKETDYPPPLILSEILQTIDLHKPLSQQPL